MSELTIEINSPTSEFKERLINSLVGITPTIVFLNKVVFVDDANTERDSTTNLNFQIDTPNNRLVITCSITASASYTLNKVRIYDYNNIIAFETTVTTNIVEGTTYNVTIYVRVTATPQTNLTFYVRQFYTLVYNVLRGTASPDYLKITRVVFSVYIIPEGRMGELPVTASNTKLSNTQMRTTGQVSVSGGVYSLCGFKVRNTYGGTNNDLYEYVMSTCQDITLDSTISYTETITIQ